MLEIGDTFRFPILLLNDEDRYLNSGCEYNRDDEWRDYRTAGNVDNCKVREL
jgi:hypothetical protein